jgi:hypothetical protein
MSDDVSQENFEKFVEDILLNSAQVALPWFAEKDKKLARRIAATERKRPPDSGKLEALLKTREEIAADRRAIEWALSALRDRMVRLRSFTGDFPPTKKREFLFAIWGAMGAAFEIGAKANSSTSAGEFGRSTVSAKGGKRSGAIRRENRHWVPEAENLAKEIRAEQPNISQMSLATEIAARWKSENLAPGHDTLVEYIATMENAGQLPRRRAAG